MAKKKELKEAELKAILERVISNAEDLGDSKLRRERQDVLSYYRGELPLPLHKGDSRYVSRDVFDAVDSMRATIAETFLTHQKIVSFAPEYGETVEQAKQATEYTRHLFYKENDGEGLIYDALTSGLMDRAAFAKVSFKEIKDETAYAFDSLTEDEFEIFIEDFDEPEVEDIVVDDNGLYSGTVKDAKVRQTVEVRLLPPEDISILGYSSSVQKARGIVHREFKTKSELLADGFDKAKVDQVKFGDETRDVFDTEKESRFSDIKSSMFGENSLQEATQGVIVKEVYLELDMYNEGRARLWKITLAGDVILDKEQVPRRQIAAFVPLPVAHVFKGDNYAKSVIPIQNARTILFRQIINHSLMTNNGRMQVLNGAVPNPQEILDNRLGGIINVRRPDAIQPMPQAPLNPYVFNLIQLLDEDKEEVTSISKLSQGLNKDAISTQNAQGMVEQLISQSQIRQKIIARQFGRFMRELWELIYATAVDHITQDEYISVTGEYTKVNPGLWKQRKAATVQLSLGYGEQEREANKWVEFDQYFSQDPQLQAAYTPEKRYEVLSRALEHRGVEDINAILLRPEEIPPSEPSELEVLQKEQLKAQIEYTNAQAYAMRQKADTDRFNAETKRLDMMNDARMDEAELALDRDELTADIALAEKELEAAKTASDQRGIYSPA